MKINTNILVYTAVIASVLGFTGCTESTNSTTEESSKKETKVDKTVSQENFIKVLNAYHERNCKRIRLREQLPISANEKTADYNKYKNLEKLGLLKSSDTKFDSNKNNMWGDGKVKMVDGKKFELTEKGKKIYSSLDNGLYDKAGFCIAHAQVEALINYTKPMDVMGLTTVNVKYTVKPVSIVPFLDEIVKIKSFKHFKELISPGVTQKVKAQLILTEMKGWMHSREFKKSN